MKTNRLDCLMKNQLFYCQGWEQVWKMIDWFEFQYLLLQLWLQVEGFCLYYFEWQGLVYFLHSLMQHYYLLQRLYSRQSQREWKWELFLYFLDLPDYLEGWLQFQYQLWFLKLWWPIQWNPLKLMHLQLLWQLWTDYYQGLIQSHLNYSYLQKHLLEVCSQVEGLRQEEYLCDYFHQLQAYSVISALCCQYSAKLWRKCYSSWRVIGQSYLTAPSESCHRRIHHCQCYPHCHREGRCRCPNSQDQSHCQSKPHRSKKERGLKFRQFRRAPPLREKREGPLLRAGSEYSSLFYYKSLVG